MSEIDTIADDDGDEIWVGFHGTRVDLSIGGEAVCLDLAKQERFAQAFALACYQAKVNAEAGRRAEAHGQVSGGE